MSKKKKLSKKAKNPFAKTVLDVFTSNPFKGFNFRQVAAALGISDNASKELIKTMLFQLQSSNLIVEEKRGKYRLHPEQLAQAMPSTEITGKVDMKQTGKAYVITKDLPEDVFISPNNTHHALHGDMVKVHLFPKRRDHKYEGQIVEIISRAHTQFVGTIKIVRQYAFLIPDSVNVPVDIIIPLEHLNNAKNGEKAVARITDWPENANNPFGEITDVLGKPGDNNVEMNSILASFDFPLSFPAQVEKEAEHIDTTISQEQINSRRDFRDVWTCTIDPPDAKDFDDAISLKKLENGNWEVGVHIADVSYYVKQGSAIDAEGYERGTSIYMVDRTIPMLPEKLSNMVCSLRPDEEKLCFSAVFEMDKNAKLLNEWFGKTVIKSNRRYNYEEVQKMIEGGEGDFKDQLMTLHLLASKLRAERFKKGAIAFHSQEVKFILDENAKPVGAFVKEQKEANWLIEDFMLLANRRVAEIIGKKNGKQPPKTFVYRIHDVPNPEKLQNFVELVGRLGYTMKTGTRKSLADSFNSLFEKIAGKGEEKLIESVSIRTMARAEYSTHNIGHYGLAFDYYTHFTSPIRRYPDLMVHRLLERYLEGKSSVSAEEYEEKCVHSSDMERKAVEAERASVKYKQAEYLLDKVGQEFNGLISGVSKWGLFVELDETKCEGMVSLKYMNDDFYYLDEDNYRVIGQRYGKEYKLGDPVRIRVKKVDLGKKQMDFELA